MSIWFSIGSALFMAGAAMSILGQRSRRRHLRHRSGVLHDGRLHPVAGGGEPPAALAGGPSGKRRAWANPDWLAAVVQLVGTLEFNVATIRGMSIAVTDTSAYDHGVWRPDVVGSALFLISSLIALHPINGALRHALVRGRSKAIVTSTLRDRCSSASRQSGPWAWAAG